MKIGNEIKWYKPFKLVKRNRELERLLETQFLIFNSCFEDLKAEKSKVENRDKLIKDTEKTIATLELIIESLKADNQSVLESIEIKPKRKRGAK